ncbi:MAG TPA: VOC family protein [Candidatus Saccharimonadales bacterium]|nr:VOC family protein [Candidatus Saccharimonadales bacterium]
MFQDSKAFSGFSVNDLDAAKAFYGDKLGLTVHEVAEGLVLEVNGNSNNIFIYPKPDHVPAAYTILNFPVDDIDQTAQALTDAGISLEQYEGMTDEHGIARGISAHRGPDILWFKDPAGNILSALHEPERQ